MDDFDVFFLLVSSLNLIAPLIWIDAFLARNRLRQDAKAILKYGCPNCHGRIFLYGSGTIKQAPGPDAEGNHPTIFECEKLVCKGCGKVFSDCNSELIKDRIYEVDAEYVTKYLLEDANKRLWKGIGCSFMYLVTLGWIPLCYLLIYILRL